MIAKQKKKKEQILESEKKKNCNHFIGNTKEKYPRKKAKKIHIKKRQAKEKNTWLLKKKPL